MESPVAPQCEPGDLTLVKVGASSNPSSIAAVIAHAIYEGKHPQIRAIGASAVNQAVKACAIARGFVATRGWNLYLIPGFESLLDEVEDRGVSAITLMVVCKRE